MNMLAAEVQRIDRGVKDLSLDAIHRQIYLHLRKYGIFHRRVTRLAHDTRYDEGVTAGYVDFVNAGLKGGKYKASEIVNIDETNIDFDLVMGSTLAGRGEETIGFTTAGRSSGCTVLLGVTLDMEKLRPYIIYKGANTPRSQIKKELKDVEARAKYGYPRDSYILSNPRHGWTNIACWTALTVCGTRVPRAPVMMGETCTFNVPVLCPFDVICVQHNK
jgi:hypothetical protein